ncbi:MAG TPA: recombinase family protein [Actinokineospora sp.]|nr:recombinase family protein [Actinokineospora sp.]
MTALARARMLRAVTDTPRRGVAYLRQSTKREETISDVIQRTAIKDYAARHGIVLVAEIWEQQTGRIWHKRKGVVEAMRMVEQGEADVILLWKWSRLSRRKLHWAVAEERVEKLGGSIESATEAVDVTTASGRFSRNMLVDVAEFESDRIGESWRETHDVRRARGLPATGGRRFGYDHVRETGSGERYEINSAEAEVVAWMYQAYIDGAGRPSIARNLNRRGVTTAGGVPWSEKTVADQLDGGFAAGLLHRVPVRDGQKVYLPFRDRTWESGAHESIISTDTWDAYRAARIARRKVASRTIGPAHNLAGLVRCGDEGCGYAMWRKTGSKRGPKGEVYAQFVCSRYAGMGIGRMASISERRLTSVVKAWLEGEAAADISEAAARSEAVEASQLRSRVDAEVIARELTALSREMANLTRQLGKELIPDAVYRDTLADLLAERAKLEERHAVAVHLARQAPVRPIETVRGLIDEWDTLSIQRRNELLSQVIRRILVRSPEAKYQRAQVDIEPTWAPES